MFERITRRQAVPAAAIAGGVLFACVPLTPAMGLIGVPTVAVADADATTQTPTDALSPVIQMAAAEEQRKMLAEQQARRQALELKQARRQAALLARGGGGQALNLPGGTAQVTTGGAIPTTQVTAKTRQIQALVKKYFPADQLGNAMAVSACESGHSDAKGAVNSDGTIDWGVFQLNDGGTLQGALSAIGVSYSSTAEAQKRALDTETNVKAAASIYAERGWGPWVCAYKIGVVAALYSSTPGPMDGKFDAWGKPTVNVPVVTVAPGSDTQRPADNPKPKPKPTKKPKPDPDPTTKPTPKPTPSRTPTPKPSTSRTPTPKPSQSTTPSVTPKPQPSTPQPRTSGSPR
ncbi:MAG: hypothetical protein U0R64_01100 [Candidatus Nanopelagicales bacterium]